MTTCAHCGAEGQPEGAAFCFACGAPRAVVCVGCSTALVAGARFCHVCGTDQASGGRAAGASVGVPPTAARRVTSVLFGDLVGFTSLSETRDTEDVRELLSRYFEECRRIIGLYGGTVEKFIGDAVMAVWGVPTAQEDDAERAVRAGLELVTAIAQLGSDVGLPDLAMRVGIVTGEVAVTIGAQQQGMVAGDAVNTASRVQSVAAPGQVWVDETTRLLTSSAITFVDVGSHPLKGKAEPVPLWAVRSVVAAVGGAQRADGLEAPHTGREREVRLVKELFHGVVESRRPAMLVLAGEPGVGKTRLGWEFFKYIDGLSTQVAWHHGRCLAYGEGVAFYALSEAFRVRIAAAAGLPADGLSADSQDVVATTLSAGLEALVPDDEERAWIAPRVSSLLGVSTGTTFPREDLFSAWTTFLHRVSGAGGDPVVLMVDDAQHGDDGLLAFLEHLVATAQFPCFVLLLARPALLDERPDMAARRRTTILHLETLSDDAMGDLLDGLVAGLPTGVRDGLVARAEGVPLFAVETVRSLIDKDLVVPRGGQYVLAEAEDLDLDTLGAPASLQALIAARLDTLTPEQRRVVDQVSVAGTSATRDLIGRLCPDVANLDAVLDSLVRVQVLQREASRFSAELGQYQFVQSAVRQVAYATLSRRDRKAAHLAVVRELGAVSDGADIASVLATHYLEALDAQPDAPDAADLAAQAVVQLRRAAARADSLGSKAEAAAHLATALERCGEDPRLRAEIECDLAKALCERGDYASAISHGRAAMAAFEALEDDLGTASAAVQLGRALLAGPGDVDEVERLALENLPRVGDDERSLRVRMDLLRLRLGGNPEAVAEFVDEMVLTAERLGSLPEIADSYLTIALRYLAMGAGRLGRRMLELSVDLARDAHDVGQVAKGEANLCAMWNAEDVERAAEFGRRGYENARRTGINRWVTLAHGNLSSALLSGGAWSELTALPVPEEEDSIVTVLGTTIDSLLRAAGHPVRRSWDPAAMETRDPAVGGWLALVAAGAALERGDGAGAVARASESARFMRDASGTSDDFYLAAFVLVEGARLVDDHDALRTLVEMVDGANGTAPPGVEAMHRRALGRISAREGDLAAAEEHLRASVELHQRWKAVAFETRARTDLAQVLAAAGRPVEAAEVARPAREQLRAMGAEAWLADVERVLELLPPVGAQGEGVRAS